MNELFPVETSLSPRLRWIAQHGIHTIDNGAVDESEGEKRFCAYQGEAGRKLFWGDQTGYGDTEDAALVELALRLGIKLWNEV